MNINVLVKALQYYLSCVDCTDTEKQDALKALDDCANLSKVYHCADIWHHEVYLLTPDALSDLLDIATYDTYGKLTKANGKPISFESYVQACKFIEPLQLEALQLGYDIVKDLWHENELYGSNRPDGTYNHQQ